MSKPFTCAALSLDETEVASIRARIAKHIRVTASGCHEWTGCRFADGRYGRIKVRGKYMLVHRVSYAVHRGPIPADTTVDHLCKNTLCVNAGTEHHELVPIGVNAMRGTGAAATNARKPHCGRGHELVEGNLVPNRGGRRNCLICHRAATRESLRRWRAKPGNLERHAANERARRAAAKHQGAST